MRIMLANKLKLRFTDYQFAGCYGTNLMQINPKRFVFVGDSEWLLDSHDFQLTDIQIQARRASECIHDTNTLAGASGLYCFHFSATATLLLGIRLRLLE